VSPYHGSAWSLRQGLDYTVLCVMAVFFYTLCVGLGPTIGSDGLLDYQSGAW
jgi:hypothetical protein